MMILPSPLLLILLLTDDAMNISVDLLDSSSDVEDEAGPVVPGYEVDKREEEIYELSQAMDILRTR